MPARLLTLVPQFRLLVQQQVMTQDEALQIQEHTRERLAGNPQPLPEHLEPAMLRLGTWAMLGEAPVMH